MAASTLRAGDIALVSYATDDTAGADDDVLRFVVLAPTGSGTVIHFTDRTWTPRAGSTMINDGSFAAAGGNEGTYTLTVGSDLAVGDVITITTALLNGAGINLSDASGETLYVFQGTDANTPTEFLYAADIADGNLSFNGSLVNTGLSEAAGTAIAVAHDNASFGGHATGSPQHQLQEISVTAAATSNWHGSDTGDNGGTLYDDRAHIALGGPLTAPDMQLYGAMTGGGQADAVLRIDNDETSNVGTNLTRMLRDNPAFISMEDIAFDVEDGIWFAVMNEGTDITRIVRGNIADLNNTGANPVPTFTTVFEYNNDSANSLDDKFIQGIELDKSANRIFFTLGDISNGHNFMSLDYNGSLASTRDWGPIDLAQDNTVGFNGGIEDFVIDTVNNTAYFTYVLVEVGPNVAHHNYIVRLTAPLNAVAPNPLVENYAIINLGMPANGNLDAGRLDPAQGSVRGIDYDPDANTIWFVTGRLGAAGTGGVFKYNLTSSTLTEVWEQPSNNAHNTPQAFPTTLLHDIEVDHIGDRYYLTDQSSTDHAFDGTPGTDENGGNVWSGSLGSAAGTAPTLFADNFEPNGGATKGMEINYAPTTTGLVSANAGVTEASSAPSSGTTAVVQVGGAPTLNDVDTTNLKGAVVAITGFVAGDVLGFSPSGGISGSYNANTGVLTLTGSASYAQYATVLDTISFSTSGDNPTDYGGSPSRTITFQVTDGLAYSDPATVTVNVTGINDAPINVAGAAMSYTEDTTGNAGSLPPLNAVTGISVSDVDANPSTQDIRVTLSVANGTITLRTDVAGGITGADITGGAAAAVGATSIVITATQNQINKTLAAVNGSSQANGLVYTPNANFNGADTLTITTNDLGLNGNDPAVSGTGTSEEDIDGKTLDVADVNDAPTMGGDGLAQSPAILEDTPYTDLTAPSVATLFGGDFSDALDDQDQGGANPTGTTGDTLDGIAVTVNGSNANGSWQYWDGDSWEAIGAASVDAAKTFTAATLIRFNPALNFNGAAPTLTARLIETGGPAIVNGDTVDLNPAPPTVGPNAVYTTGSVTLSQAVTAVNDAPVNTIVGDLNISEDGAVANVTGISVSDLEADPATDLISVTLDVDHGTLAILTNVAGGIVLGDIVSQDSDTISIVATQNKINATLGAAGGLTYDSDLNYFGGDTVEVTTSDLGNSGQDPVPGTGTNLDEQDVDSKTINIAAVDDVATPADDIASVDEDDTVEIDVVANDTDIDSTPAVAKIGTTAISVGNPVTLASGAIVSLGADGKLTYNPNDKFNYLIPAAEATASGAVNDSATETFSYELADGTTASVTVTVNGVDSPEDVLMGDATDNSINGTAGTDFFYVMQPGTETLDGMGGNDAFLFGAHLDATDDVDGGAGTKDQLGIQGDYSAGLTLGANNLVGIETFVLLSGTDTRFGDDGLSLYDYDITTVDENVPDGGLLKVQFNTLVAGEDVSFDGSAEQDGAFFLYAGQGQDTLIGGDGDDAFFFGHNGSAAAFTADDSVNGGDGSNDQLGLRGNYTFLVEFTATTMTNIEVLVAISSTDPRFGNTGSGFHYNLKTVDANVGNGETLSVTGAMLVLGEALQFDGVAEQDGHFHIKGGKGLDVLIGGAQSDTFFGGEGSDTLTGNGGNDVYRYRSALDSAVGSEDLIFDFTVGDKIDLTMMDANSNTVANDAFTFSNDGTFHGVAGELRAYESAPGTWFVEGDRDGGGTADFAIEVSLTNPLTPLVVGDFNL